MVKTMLAINSILHFIIDAICAYGMFGTFGGDSVNAYLFYNLCAFALQMPIGAVVDLTCSKLPSNASLLKKRFYWVVTVLGVIITVVGLYSGPLALGMGNALFHVGGGVEAIGEDEERRLKGRGLGIFVAPGALGLFVGNILSDFSTITVYIRYVWIVVCALLILIGFLRIFYEERHFSFIRVEPSAKQDKDDNFSEIILAVLGCFVVVIIRSFVGLSVSFTWKTGLILPLLSVLAVVGGKIAGGFVAARFGNGKAIITSLLLATVCYAFSNIPVLGILALFFFNMTMPITLYILVKKLPELPGFSFGLLSFGLFFGFLAADNGLFSQPDGRMVGAVGSAISLIILMAVLLLDKRKDKGLRK